MQADCFRNYREGIRLQMNRNKTIDIAKAIGIILVIMEHLVVYQGRAFTLISAFSMPLFFFLSGYCFDSKRYDSTVQFLGKKFKTIIVPYLGFLTLGLVITLVIPAWREGCFDSPLLMRSIFYYAQPEQFHMGQIWFLMALFWAQILFYIFERCIRAYGTTVKVLFVICSIYIGQAINGLIVVPEIYRLPWKIDSAVMGMAFMAIGYYFKEYKVFEKFGTNKAFIFAIAVMIFWITGNANECVNLCDAVYSDVVLFIMAAMSGIICTYIVSDVLVQVQWISKFMSYIGRNTLVIFGTHSLAISLVVYIMNKLSGMGYIAQVNIPFIICVLAMMMIMVIEILGVWGYGKLKGFVRKR